MIKFIRTNQNTWDTVDKTLYSDSIVFIEDIQQMYVNNVNYFGKKLTGIERVEFSTSSISIEPNKFYFCNEILNELDITLLGEGIRNYFVEFICDNTCVILPSNIKWKNNIVPDFTKTAIMTIKIQDDIAYLIDCRPLYLEPYVTFTAEEDNSSIGLEKISTKQTLEYSTDNSIWNAFDTTTNISLNNEDKVYVRGILSGDNTNSNYTQFKMSGKIAASGNCNAIWNYQDLEAPLKAYCGYYIFKNCTSLTTAPELSATKLVYSCYHYMFSNCTSLTISPELPATTLAHNCYRNMFEGCTSLTILPELPATTLASHCYYYMFYNCTSLTATPKLPATTLTDYCYDHMFYGCSSLAVAPELPATTLAEGCYSYMFQNCTSLTTAPELPATTLAKSCYRYMFWDCTSLTTAPVLPTATLVAECYFYMFFGCTSLNYIKCLATDMSATNCNTRWVGGVSSTGTFVKHPDMNDWPTGAHGIPNGWIVENAEIYR